jgi:hypothetical protein
MKNKVTWKPPGLKAKRWRAASEMRGAANVLPAHTPMRRPRRRDMENRPPYAAPLP